jgi:hypothetical protein
VKHDELPTPAWNISVPLRDEIFEELTFPKSLNYLNYFTEQVKSLNISNWPHLTDLSNIVMFKNLETLLLNNNYNLGMSLVFPIRY